jgi:hypothetical protein
MKFMLIVKESDADKHAMLSDRSTLAGLVHAHEAMRSAGVLLSVEGLHESAEAVRVRHAGHKQYTTRGPSKDGDAGISGFWLIQVNSMDEAVEWARKVPLVDGEIEVRQAAFQILETGDGSPIPVEREHEAAALVCC